MDTAIKLSDSLEDYTEVIYYICRRKATARPSEIADYIGVKASSVTHALRALASVNMVTYSRYKSVLLSPLGHEYAQELLRRTRLTYEFLHFVLGLDAATADSAATKMRKGLTGKVLEKMEIFLKRHARVNAHAHEDCMHNEMRCILCQISDMPDVSLE